jgi:hypothetical protein
MVDRGAQRPGPGIGAVAIDEDATDLATEDLGASAPRF